MPDVTFGPFGGIKSGLNPAHIPPAYAAEQVNLTADGADLRWRLGFTSWSAAPGGFTSCRALAYVSGSDDTAVAERILSIETRSGTTKPYTVDLATAVRTEITDAGAGLSLAAVPWHVLAYGKRALCFARGQGSVYGHEIGTTNTWDELDAAQPAIAASPATVAWEFTESISGDAPQTPWDWTGAAGATVIDQGGDGGPVTFGAVGTGNRIDLVGTTDNVPFPTAVFDLDLNTITAGMPNLSNAKRIDFKLIIPSNIVNGSTFITNLSGIRVWIINNAGVPVQQELTVADVITNDPTTGSWPKTHNLQCTAANGETMGASFATVRKLRIEFTYDPVANGNENQPWNFYVSPVTPQNASPLSPTITAQARVQFGHVAYDSLRDVEANSVRPTSWFSIEAPNRYALDGATALIGNIPILTGAAPADADSLRYFVRIADEGGWRLIGTRPKTDPTIRVELSLASLRALPLRTAPDPEPIGSPAYAFAHAGAVFYLYSRGKTNVRASWNGVPERLRKATDDLEDVSRGVDWTLTAAGDDEPVWGASSGASAIILGRRGAYSMTGLLASEMTPPKKLAGGQGVFGTAAVRWRADNGAPGVAYLGSDFGIWFAYTAEGIGGDAGGYVQELTRDQRGLPAAWLTLTPATDPESIAITADDMTDSLWLIRGARALVLRRSGQFDAERQWECYEYTGGNWSKATFVPGQGVRVMHSGGAIHQLERTTAGAAIGGATRDNGIAPTIDGRRRFPRLAGQRIRLARIACYRTAGQAVSCTVESRSAKGAETKQVTYALASEQRHVRLDKSQHGDEHDITLIVPVSDGAISTVQVEAWPMHERTDS